jgi:CHAT domain-containing protein
MDTDNYQYQAALEKLLQAKDIYEKQSLVFQLARVYIQLGELYKKTVRSPMTTRDLVFEDYEITVVSLDISSDEALRISDEYFAKAEKIAERYSITNLLWKAFQGRAFVLKQSGDLPKAEKLYEKAINMVLSMKGFEENSELLLHYLKDKDDLFTEAIEVCNSLYQQTKDESFLRKQMEYDEIYRNEILKANMQMGNIEYTDPEKRSLFDSLKQLDAKSKKADKAAQAAAFAAEAPKSSKATKIALEQAQQESKLIKEQYEKYLSQWKATFKNDSVMFDSEGKIDINALKRFLTDDQAIIQYIPLPDKLTIIVITKESIISVEKEVSTNELEKLIRNDYIANSIEKFGRIEPNKTEEADKLYQETMDQLIRMSELLYIPIQQHLVGKDRLFIVTSKFLSYVPYNALIIGIVDNQRPKFLVEEKVISLVRYSFLDNALNNISKSYNKNIISLGNPQHTIMSSVLGNLPGAEAESAKIKNIVENHAQNLLFKNFIRNDARKETFISEIQNNKYGIMHFSTHGVPFSEIIFSNKKFQNYIDKPEEKKLKTLKKAKINKAYNDKIFTNNSHFNGFLMMSADENDLKKGSLSLNDLLAMDEENFNANYMDYINSLDTDSKLLTIKDIISMNDGLFSEAYLALLSACNTAVSFTSKVIASEDFETSSEYADLDDDDIKTIPKEMADLGWTPGLDEVCFVDIFMRKNFQYVLGSLWFLPDASTALIMEYFMVNLLSGESKDPPEALTEAMRTYLNYVSTGGKVSYIKPLHPFYWAGGNIFGI